MPVGVVEGRVGGPRRVEAVHVVEIAMDAIVVEDELRTGNGRRGGVWKTVGAVLRIRRLMWKVMPMWMGVLELQGM